MVVMFVVVFPAVGLSGDNDIAVPAKVLPLTLALPIVFYAATLLNTHFPLAGRRVLGETIFGERTGRF